MLYNYLIQISQYPKCAVLSSMFDRDSFYLLWVSVLTPSQKHFCVEFVKPTPDPVLKYPCFRSVESIAFLLFRFHAVRYRVLWPLDRTVDGPRTTLDVCCFLETKYLGSYYVH